MANEITNEGLFKNADAGLVKFIQFIRDSIKGSKYEGKVHLCGGTVRDLMLGVKPNSNLDFAVEIKGGGISFAKWITKKHHCHGKNNPVNCDDWGTAYFSIDTYKEFAEFTVSSSQTNKVWPESSAAPIEELFGTLEQDAATRDFTINAIYYNLSTGTIYNALGVSDIDHKIIRCPRESTYTFRVSPVRMLRCIRLASQYGFSIEKTTWMGMLKLSHRVKRTDKIDIRIELNKMLMLDKPSVALNRLFGSGVLKHLLPNIYSLKDGYENYANRYTYLQHTFDVTDAVFPFLDNRIAALFHEIGRNVQARGDIDDFSASCAADELSELGYSKSLVKNVSTAIQYHRYFSIYGDGVEPSTKRINLFKALCKDDMPLVLDVMNANNNCSQTDHKPRQVMLVLKKIEELDERAKKEETKLPINGDDIIEFLSIKKGPRVGYLLDKVKKAIEKEGEKTKDECLKIAQKAYADLYG